MSRDGSGTYTVPNVFTPSTIISSTDNNTNWSDMGNAMTASIAKDGQTTPTANLPMGGFKHTGTALATALTNYARADQVQDEALTWMTVGGTGDAITLASIPVPTSYVTGSRIRFKATAGNTTAVVVNRDSLGARNLRNSANGALVLGDIVTGQIYEATYDGTQFLLQHTVPSQSAASTTFIIPVVIDGGGTDIAAGTQIDIPTPFACTINSVTAMSRDTGSIIVDVWADSYANWPPTDADSIVAAAPITISSGTKYRDSTLTGWDTTHAADTTFTFNVDTCTGISRITIYLNCTRT